MDSQLYVAIAEIAGVFVAFGALIGVTGRPEIATSELGRIRAVVTIGLVVIVAAVVPVMLATFGLADQILWRVSSILFLGLVWSVTLLSLGRPENRGMLANQIRRSPASAIFFWLVLEIPIQGPLILTILGLFPEFGQALYTVALGFNLFQAAFILAQLVYASSEGRQAS